VDMATTVNMVKEAAQIIRAPMEREAVIQGEKATRDSRKRSIDLS